MVEGEIASRLQKAEEATQAGDMEAVCALMDDYSREVQALANNEVIKAEETEHLPVVCC